MPSKPRTLQECYDYLLEVLSPQEIEEIRNLRPGEVWQTHFSLASRIQHELLEGNPELQERFENSAAGFCVDCSEIPDLIAEGFWDHLQIMANHHA